MIRYAEPLGIWLLAILLCLASWQANYEDWQRIEAQFTPVPLTDTDYQAILPQLRQAGLLSTDKALRQRVDDLSATLVERIDTLYPESQHPWEVLVIKGDDNAFVIGAGRLAVGETLIQQHQLSDDELAIVLSHEMAHIVLGHEHRMQDLLQQHLQLARFIKVVTGDDPDNSLAMDLWLLGRLLPAKRQMEVEADQAAVVLVASAGYDPTGFLSLMDKIAPDDLEGVPVWLRDHPPIATRKIAVRPYLENTHLVRY